MDYSTFFSFSENVGIRLQFLPVTLSEICRGQSNDDGRGSVLHYPVDLFGRLFDLRQLAVVENVCAYHAVKIIVNERKVPHLVLDKSDAVNGSSLQSIFECFERCFGDVKGYNLKALFAEEHGMTTRTAT